MNDTRWTQHSVPGVGCVQVDRYRRYGKKVVLGLDLILTNFNFSARGREELEALKHELGSPRGFHPGGGCYASLPAVSTEREDEVTAQLLAIVNEPANLEPSAVSRARRHGAFRERP